MSENVRRALAAASLVLLVIAARQLKNVEKSIQDFLTANAARSAQIGGRSSLDQDPKKMQQKHGLDNLTMQLELPRSEAEVRALAPLATRPLWRSSLRWDFLFILSYVALFVSLSFPGAERTTMWESLIHCAVVAAVADCVENYTVFKLLESLDQGDVLRNTHTLIGLPIISAVKWLLVFLAIRAVSIQFEKYVTWRGLGVWLRAAATAGSWTAILTLLGLPGRPVLSLMTLISGALLIVAAAMRIGGVVPGTTVEDADRERPEPDPFSQPVLPSSPG
ncbi:MAG: hypothetical protein ABI779_13945 [Acidobacteriota bacterium]